MAHSEDYQPISILWALICFFLAMSNGALYTHKNELISLLSIPPLVVLGLASLLPAERELLAKYLSSTAAILWLLAIFVLA
ncbi:hypothetical protein Halru_0706 [Halovivax ruber XH-70]|uniref:Uncharacterized protein n=1 Tax=Halovivax ruber (strain DSM 18193 / JCM 13892 / XH-70) TaxID=797302 RepID=L0I961_HALRX|nr:hypothetical protein Halru_0706 [Halovivax ruber XH-70]